MTSKLMNGQLLPQFSKRCSFCKLRKISTAPQILSIELIKVQQPSFLLIRSCSNYSSNVIEREPSDPITEIVTDSSEQTDNSHSTPVKRFLDEVKLRAELSGKLEKVRVKHVGHNKNMEVEVNRNYSTPLDVARHLGRNYVTLSAVALLNASKVVDMNQAISEKENVTLQFVWFKNQQQQDPHLANKTLWNTCSLLSGAVLGDIFKETIKVIPHLSTPDLTATEGAFGFEFELVKTDSDEDDRLNWTASQSELSFVNRKLRSFIYSKPDIYGLDCGLKSAEKVLGADSSNLAVAKHILSHFGDSVNHKVRLYLCGGSPSSPSSAIHLHPGPLLPNVHLVGQMEITAVYPLGCTGLNGASLHRIEGVALPSVLHAHHWPWTVLTSAAREDALSRQTLMPPNSIESFAEWYKNECKWRNNSVV